MHLISLAMGQINEDNLISLSHQAIPTAIAATAFLKSQGMKEVEPSWFNPFQKALDKLEAGRLISLATAKTYRQLELADRLPPWVLKYKDVSEKVRLLVP